MHERRFSGGVERLRDPGRVERLEVDRVAQLCLEGVDLNTVLDVGTGSGLFAEAFVRHSLVATAIDANPDMLPAARAACAGVVNGVQCGLAQAVAEQLPFKTGSFDVIFYGLVLHETDDVRRALQEAHRMSRKRVCILEWPYSEQSFGPPISDRLSPDRLESLFRQAGFQRWDSVQLSNTVLYRLDS